jgi:PEGA domain
MRMISLYRFCHLYGTLVVNSDRSSAVLTIDGVDFGHPPNLLFLPPGQHKLIVRAPNAPDKTRTVQVKAGYRTSVEINFSGGSPETKIEPEGRPSGSPLPTPAPGHEKPAAGMYVIDHEARTLCQ